MKLNYFKITIIVENDNADSYFDTCESKYFDRECALSFPIDWVQDVFEKYQINDDDNGYTFKDLCDFFKLNWVESNESHILSTIPSKAIVKIETLDSILKKEKEYYKQRIEAIQYNFLKD